MMLWYVIAFALDMTQYWRLRIYGYVVCMHFIKQKSVTNFSLYNDPLYDTIIFHKILI